MFCCCEAHYMVKSIMPSIKTCYAMVNTWTHINWPDTHVRLSLTACLHIV